MKVFASWSGVRSHQIAIYFQEWLALIMPGIELWLSDDIPGGGRWSIQLAEKLKDTHTGIIFLTTDNLVAPWIYFEAGAISKTVDNAYVYPYLFDLTEDDIQSTPFGQFQARLATKEGTRKLIHDLNRGLENEIPEGSLNHVFNRLWNDLEKNFNNIRKNEVIVYDLEGVEWQFKESISRLKKDSNLLENKFLRRVVLESIQEQGESLQHIRPQEQSYLVPYIQYPSYLIKLLKGFKSTQTKAIAIVENDETFWPQKPGYEILKHTSRESIRLFAFRSKEQFRASIDTINDHSSKYQVYVISYDNMSKAFAPKPYDFSIIGDVNAVSILAFYSDEDPLLKKVNFTSNKESISKHHDIFLEVLDIAIPLNKDDNLKKRVDQMTESVFAPIPLAKISRLDKKPVEMSSYIHPHEYDKHEELHAYYVEMMDRMIEIYLDNKNSSIQTEALEMGAGTGLFTKRLVEREDVEITAIEIDWACYHVLLDKMRRIEDMRRQNSEESHTFSEGTYESGRAVLRKTFKSQQLNVTIKCDNEDGRTYDPPGTFHFIFSSFADHHIKLLDKPQYFENLKKNLKPGGAIIIGDEFLPSYDEADPESHRDALRVYHNHIIEETKRQHGRKAFGLIKLEEAALESGLKGIGDFKVSCDIYERYLLEAGFKYEKEKIGPLNRDDLGGIYVYVLRLQD